VAAPGRVWGCTGAVAAHRRHRRTGRHHLFKLFADMTDTSMTSIGSGCDCIHHHSKSQPINPTWPTAEIYMPGVCILSVGTIKGWTTDIRHKADVGKSARVQRAHHLGHAVPGIGTIGAQKNLGAGAFRRDGA